MKKIVFAIFMALFGLTGYSQVTLYTGCDYSGTSSILSEGSYSQLSQLKLSGSSVNSLKVPPGYTVELYENADFKGRKLEFKENLPCLPAIFRDKTTSVRVIKNALANDGKISIYSSCKYRGNVTHWPPVDYSDLDKTLKGSRPYAIQIPKGIAVELYEGPNFTGKLLAKYTENQSCLPGPTRRYARSMKVYVIKEPIAPAQPRQNQ